ncbi:hypothetical protein ERJ75_000089500 [Trypanosoma vivax]|nr:hypothetical protein ERJ75_001672700 [Trypanosoma vivax]KAH8605156.1 hypothetical protein ERJ75_001672500 [Trypanosoma vivax]KAH8620185.1 hypothetical protein ERJ75_000089500 [Trypanosoma vivax]
MKLPECFPARACVALDARQLPLHIGWGVGRKPAPQIRGAQWNPGVFSRVKQVALERKLHEDMASFCHLQEACLALAACAALKIGGCQQMGRAGAPN